MQTADVCMLSDTPQHEECAKERCLDNLGGDLALVRAQPLGVLSSLSYNTSYISWTSLQPPTIGRFCFVETRRWCVVVFVLACWFIVCCWRSKPKHYPFISQ